jgi:hypothetical protein
MLPRIFFAVSGGVREKEEVPVGAWLVSSIGRMWWRP